MDTPSMIVASYIRDLFLPPDPQLEAGATLEQGYLGISVQEATDPNQSGVTVAAVETGSGAAAAGLRAGESSPLWVEPPSTATTMI